MVINLTQKFVYETDSLESFEKVLDTMVQVMYKEKPSLYAHLHVSKNASDFDNGKRLIDPRSPDKSAVWSKPTRIHVCSIADYEGNIKQGDEKFEYYSDLVARVMDHIKKADVKKFFVDCGDGYNSFFNDFDGSIDVGYRLNHRPIGGWKALEVSLCHVYYGK